MATEPEEQRLDGGNTNSVVRVGDTVRRQTSSHSDTIHAFLRHLEKKGFPAPRLRGIDQSGREVLAFIEGKTRPPDTLWKDDGALIEAARLLRSLHDASLDFVPAKSASWAYTYPLSSRREVICHNDFAPYNMVFEGNLPIAVLDFDLCGPGPRIRDLAYLSYWLAPLSFSSDDLRTLSEKEARSGCRRLGLLCDTYGGQSPGDVLKMVSEVLHDMSDEDFARRMVGANVAEKLKSEGHFDHWSREAYAFDQMRDRLSDIVSD